MLSNNFFKLIVLSLSFVIASFVATPSHAKRPVLNAEGHWEFKFGWRVEGRRRPGHVIVLAQATNDEGYTAICGTYYLQGVSPGNPWVGAVFRQSKIFINHQNALYAMVHFERSLIKETMAQNFTCQRTRVPWFDGANEAIRFDINGGAFMQLR